jgi:hypothetical protein
MWIIPLTIGIHPSVEGAALVGLAHGRGRAVNILMLSDRAIMEGSLWQALLRGRRRSDVVDRLCLLVGAGILSVYAWYQL